MRLKHYSFNCVFKLHDKEKVYIVEIDYNLIKITENCKSDQISLKMSIG